MPSNIEKNASGLTTPPENSGIVDTEPESVHVAARHKCKKTEESVDSTSPRGSRKGGSSVGVSPRNAKRSSRGHQGRSFRGHPAKSRSHNVTGSRFQHRGSPASGGRASQERQRQQPKDEKETQDGHQKGNREDHSQDKSQPPAPDALPPSASLEVRRSTYFSICLNASPDELTVVSYNLNMENSWGVFDGNWKRREAALLRYLLSLDETHHPDVLLIQGAFSSSTQRLLRRLHREEPMFAFQTRVVGADPGCCKTENEEGYCSCYGDCWWCLTMNSRKATKKSQAEAFVTKNGWDSVCGSFSRFRGNGGILILSKWPMLRRHAYIFSASAYPQSRCNAGAALVQVEKCGKVYNMLAMQLQPGPNNNALRVAQVKEVMAWARTGMEDAEKVEFASCDVDEAFASPGEGSTGTEGSVASNESPSKPEGSPTQKEGLPELELNNAPVTTETELPKAKPHRRRAELPKGILKATDPLIIGGNLNFRFTADRASLAEALGSDGFNANLALEDASVAQPNFDTVNNDTCYQSQGCPETPKQELLDYLLIYSEHAGRVARGQRTLVDPSPAKIPYRPMVMGCIPRTTLEVSHVSDFFPVCATFAHNSE
ncbi:endonuclease/exonuclease/phosphatase domain-containing protein, putative [Eimeria mitis]|uniref:Endonuclease/exonuclease/phosphatase domain-containing protein, putative n=1 Tax=Eimeria mitis TaxID=44415 RepID=U6JZM7_9EIME|nr:endonuclease/exonuclease/phosphatase domain-containing protein, putative [Eimeria mitis]CDJ30206.1 endonuclease/exonuclease/phosphatase domain-containing protein, putative [Eimeria mitis]